MPVVDFDPGFSRIRVAYVTNYRYRRKNSRIFNVIAENSANFFKKYRYNREKHQFCLLVVDFDPGFSRIRVAYVTNYRYKRKNSLIFDVITENCANFFKKYRYNREKHQFCLLVVDFDPGFSRIRVAYVTNYRYRRKNSRIFNVIAENSANFFKKYRYNREKHQFCLLVVDFDPGFSRIRVAYVTNYRYKRKNSLIFDVITENCANFFKKYRYNREKHQFCLLVVDFDPGFSRIRVAYVTNYRYRRKNSRIFNVIAENSANFFKKYRYNREKHQFCLLVVDFDPGFSRIRVAYVTNYRYKRKNSLIFDVITENCANFFKKYRYNREKHQFCLLVVDFDPGFSRIRVAYVTNYRYRRKNSRIFNVIAENSANFFKKYRYNREKHQFCLLVVDFDPGFSRIRVAYVTNYRYKRKNSLIFDVITENCANFFKKYRYNREKHQFCLLVVDFDPGFSRIRVAYVTNYRYRRKNSRIFNVIAENSANFFKKYRYNREKHQFCLLVVDFDPGFSRIRVAYVTNYRYKRKNSLIFDVITENCANFFKKYRYNREKHQFCLLVVDFDPGFSRIRVAYVTNYRYRRKNSRIFNVIAENSANFFKKYRYNREKHQFCLLVVDFDPGFSRIRVAYVTNYRYKRKNSLIFDVITENCANFFKKYRYNREKHQFCLLVVDFDPGFSRIRVAYVTNYRYRRKNSRIFNVIAENSANFFKKYRYNREKHQFCLLVVDFDPGFSRIRVAYVTNYRYKRKNSLIFDVITENCANFFKKYRYNREKHQFCLLVVDFDPGFSRIRVAYVTNYRYRRKNSRIFNVIAENSANFFKKYRYNREKHQFCLLVVDFDPGFSRIRVAYVTNYRYKRKNSLIFDVITENCANFFKNSGVKHKQFCGLPLGKQAGSGEFGIERELALATLQAAQVPRSFHSQQVEAIGDFLLTAGTNSPSTVHFVILQHTGKICVRKFVNEIFKQN
ncbi:hypothetical protein LSTR_LSTR013109 [Laodelphax striatellus]|uniref:Uncharacterized protein n=1 Tax=Laodelphax striatellus TaxID=195883 RepID=A0A482WLM4_LAOST|nr:hypothetical protein LSTR_LSTR013109 [Laodelphax striatellus]